MPSETKMHRPNLPLSLLFLCALCVLCGGSLLPAAEPEVADKDLPRFPAIEPKDAPATFRLRPGFQIQLAACEPQIASPVAMAFDENNRLYVVEMIGYSERRDEKLGEIRLLEDSDGDGVFDKSTIFATGLAWPTAIFPWKGGVFVGCTPDILYLKDTDGDGRADEKRVVFTGFADNTKKLNVQALLNSFNWGLDNRIHGAASFSGGHVGRAKMENGQWKIENPVDLRGKGFDFDPRTENFSAEDGGGQHGLSFDDWGRLYVNSNSHHLQTFAYPSRYIDRHSDFVMPAPLIDIAVDGPAAEVYRISPEEPWRIVRTKWRVSGISKGPIEGGGRSAGYFTGATGVTIYRGNAYRPEFQNNAFIGDAGGNLVHRKIIQPSGAIVSAARAPDEQKSEFAASTDTWFRPVQFANSPDGCLYVIDMYRQTIEHPWSLPESLKKHLDLNAGNDRGRIYRIVPEGFKQPPKINLSRASIEELVSMLKHPNGWHRDTAARLLYEKQGKSAIPLLEKILSPKPASPDRLSSLARLHALYALDGLNGLKVEHVLAAMNDSSEHLRRHAILLSEKFLADPAARSQLADKFDTLLADPSIQVRYQLTLTLSLLRDDQLPRRLAKILAAPVTDSWIKAAALNAIGDRALDLLRLLDPASDLAPQLTQLIAGRGIGDEIAALIELAIAQKTDAATMHVAAALATGLQKAGIPLEAEKGQPLIERATALAANASANLQTRMDAVTVLGAVTWDPSADTLLPLLSPTQPREIQLAVLNALDHLDKGQLADEILTRWNTFTPTLRQSAAAILIKRPARAAALLQAIQSKAFHPADLSPAQTAALRQNPDQAVKQLANKLLTAPTSNRQAVIQAFAPALDLKGDPKKGHEIYTARCATCHRLAGEGTALGPDLETVKNAGKEKLLTNILDPNKEVAPNYTAYIVETKEGDTQTGIIASEFAAAVTLKMAAGMELTLNRAAIKSIKSTAQSMMPEGVEEGLKPQDLADLLEFVMQGKNESKP